MKKIVIILCFALLAVPEATAQLTQRGKVTEMSSGGRPVAGCEIMAAGAIPTDSDNDGHFSLVFGNALPGDPLLGLSVYKKGYMVVNAEKLASWGISGSSEIRIVLGKKEIIDELRKKYYDIGMSSSERKYLKAMSELKYERNRQKVSEREFIRKCDSIERELSRIREKIAKFSRKFACLDRDILDEQEKEAITLLDAGDITGAIRIYEEMDLETRLADRKEAHAAVREDLNTLLPSLINNFHLLKETGDTAGCDSLANIIADAAERIEDKLIPAEWLLQNGNDKAISIYALLISQCRSLEDINAIERSFTNLSDNRQEHMELIERIRKKKVFLERKNNITGK